MGRELKSSPKTGEKENNENKKDRNQVPMKKLAMQTKTRRKYLRVIDA
jgi:hypothetical protein